MKIQDTGLPGKAAKAHKAFMWHSRGFNAFQGMTREKGRFNGPKKDVFLNFMGTEMLIDQDEQGEGRGCAFHQRCNFQIRWMWRRCAKVGNQCAFGNAQ
jgi:hypothetical protein